MFVGKNNIMKIEKFRKIAMTKSFKRRFEKIFEKERSDCQ